LEPDPVPTREKKHPPRPATTARRTYLSWKVRRFRSHEIRFVELAQAVNSEMPRHVVERCSLLLNDQGKAVRGSRVLGIGAAYKAGIEDTRQSATLKVLEGLQVRGAEITYHDPLVPAIELGGPTPVPHCGGTRSGGW
jgi:UDP-N-acetyl-D-mannosaminuronate dehydrogenase